MDSFLLVMLNFILQEHMNISRAMGAGRLRKGGTREIERGDAWDLQLYS